MNTIAKAIASSVVYAAFTLVQFVTGDETLADVTTQEWLLAVIGLGAAYGIVYAVPNKTEIPGRYEKLP